MIYFFLLYQFITSDCAVYGVPAIINPYPYTDDKDGYIKAFDKLSALPPVTTKVVTSFVKLQIPCPVDISPYAEPDAISIIFPTQPPAFVGVATPPLSLPENNKANFVAFEPTLLTPPPEAAFQRAFKSADLPDFLIKFYL